MKTLTAFILISLIVLSTKANSTPPKKTKTNFTETTQYVFIQVIKNSGGYFVDMERDYIKIANNFKGFIDDNETQSILFMNLDEEHFLDFQSGYNWAHCGPMEGSQYYAPGNTELEAVCCNEDPNKKDE